MKRCSKCKGDFHLEDFHVDRSRSDGRTKQCKGCIKKYSKEYRTKTGVPERIRKSRLRHHVRVAYGLTLEQVEEMKREQEGLCAICSKECGHLFYRQGLQIDHDHISGRVRGLLCHNCNVGIGFLQESPAILKAAIRYLETFQNRA